MERRTALRLRVVYRRVVCPFGRNDMDDSFIAGSYRTSAPVEGKLKRGPHRLLHDCYLDAATPNHPCGGCSQVEKWKTEIGLRTYRVEPEQTSVNTVGQPHQQYPVKVIYLPLTSDGLRWFAMNWFTGQRHEVILRRDTVTVNNQTIELTRRLTPEGLSIENTVRLRNVNPTWNAPFEGEWRCECATCTGEEAKMQHDPEDDDDDVNPFATNRPRKSAYDYPSAPARTGMSMYSGKPATQAQVTKAAKKAGLRSSSPATGMTEGFTMSFGKRPKTHPRNAEYARQKREEDDVVTHSDAMTSSFKKLKDKKPDERKPGMKQNFGSYAPPLKRKLPGEGITITQTPQVPPGSSGYKPSGRNVKTRVVPPEEVTPKNLTAEHHINQPKKTKKTEIVPTGRRKSK